MQIRNLITLSKVEELVTPLKGEAVFQNILQIDPLSTNGENYSYFALWTHF